MPDAAVLAWRQYRLERRMFWRNPSAAFFNFLLPLLFLAGGGIILSGNQHQLNRLVPAIAAMSVMSTTFTALAYNIVFLRERGVLLGIGWPRDWGELIVFTLAGVVCFCSLGIAFAHLIPNFESTAAYVNAVFLPVVFLSFYVFDSKSAPGFLRNIVDALPLKPLIDGLSAGIVTGSGLSGRLDALAVIALWGALGCYFAVRGFSWEQGR